MSGGLPPQIGPWRIERELGRGGEGRVLLGVDAAGRRAAVKWYRSPTEAGRERRLLKWLADTASGDSRSLGPTLSAEPNPGPPRIPVWWSEGVWQGRPWMATGWIDGMDLDSWGERLRRRPPGERHARVRHLARALADSIGWLHAQGVVHRDLKPSNVRVTPEGAPVLIDFGIAAADDDPGAAARAFSPAWSAPEQRTSTVVDPRSDQYGLGALIYALLSGEPPPTSAGPLGPSPARSDPTVPADLDAWVQRLLAPSPAARFADLARARDALGDAGDAGERIAGRDEVIRQAAAAVDRAAAGEALRVVLRGVCGSGKGWLCGLIQELAAKRRVRVSSTGAPPPLTMAAHPAELVLELHPPGPVPDAPTGPSPASNQGLAGATPATCVLTLGPLSLSDVRRTVHELPGDVATDAVKAWRWSGGNVGLLVDWMRQARGNPPALARWLAPLSGPARQTGAALAMVEDPVELSDLDAAIHAWGVVTAEALAELECAGIVRAVGASRWALAAEAFRAPLRDTLDPSARSGLAAALRDDPLLAEVRALPAPDDARRRLEHEIYDPLASAPEARGPACWSEPRPPHAAARWCTLGELRLRCGDPAGARQAFVEALQAPGRRALESVRAELGCARAAWHEADVDGAEQALGRARAIPGGGAGRDPWVGAMEAEILSARGEAAALDRAREAAALGEAGSSLSAACDTRLVLGMLLLDHGERVSAEVMCSDACALARAAEQPLDRARAHGLRAFAALAARPERAVAAVVLDRFRRLDAGDPAMEAAWSWALAVLGDRTGSLRRAEIAAAALVREPRILQLRIGLALEYAATTRGEPRARAVLLNRVPEGLPGWRAWVERGWLAPRP